MSIEVKNRKLFIDFMDYLENENVSDKTKTKHAGNVDFFINEYLTHRVEVTCADGIDYVDDFLSNYFVNKCAWSSKNAVKENITSIKKFYKFMLQEGYISKKDHKDFLGLVRDEKESWIEGGYSSSGLMDDFNRLLDRMMNEKHNDFSSDFFDELDETIEVDYSDVLKEVYTHIKRIIELKPWEWLPNDQLLAIRNPDYQENEFLSVLGHQGGDKGIMIHEDYLGLNGFMMMYSKEGMTGHDIKINMHGYVINLFEDKYLDDVSKKYIKESGVTFTDKTLMPVIYDFAAGFLPVIIDIDDLEMLEDSLEKAVTLFEADVKERKKILSTPLTEVYGFHRKKGRMTLTELEREIYFFDEDLLEVDDLTKARVKKSCKKTNDTWEIDFFYHPAIIDLEDGSRPHFPSVFIIADPNKEQVVYSAIIEDWENYKGFNQVFVDGMIESGIIPSTLYVTNQDMFQAFFHIAQIFDIELRPMNSSEIINDFKHGFHDEFGN